MKIYTTILIVILSFCSCIYQKKENTINIDQTIEHVKERVNTDLKLDHFNIWTNNPQKAKEKLENIGFKAVPDSLSKIHSGQGTTGRFFYFLNTYLELIYVYDKKEFKENSKKNHQLDFIERASFKKNGASPFSIALKIKDYEVDKIPFEKIKYHQDWMTDNRSIYAAKNSKLNLKEPSVFVVYPEIEADDFKTYTDLKQIPKEFKFGELFSNIKMVQKK